MASEGKEGEHRRSWRLDSEGLDISLCCCRRFEEVVVAARKEGVKVRGCVVAAGREQLNGAAACTSR